MRSEKTKVGRKFYSYSFVSIQFACLAILLSTGPILAEGWLFFVQSGAVALGLWALFSMRGGVLRILPDVSEKAILISQGPYRVIRHPMYTAVIVLMVALVCNAPTLVRFVTVTVLCIDLLAKLFYEEKLLEKSFGEYRKYSKTTWRLIPFIF